MPNEPLFSLIVPGFNIASCLRRSYASVLAQTCPDYELIFIDDGSTDGTGEQMDSLAQACPRPAQVIHQTNKGPGGARNAGIRAARGRYLVFLDGDDAIEPELLSLLRDIIERKHPPVIVYNGYTVDARGNRTPMQYCGTLEGDYEPKRDREILSTYAGVWNKAIERSFTLEKGFSFPEGVWYEDAGISRLWLMAAPKVTITQERLYLYHQRERSIMHSEVSPRMKDDCLAVSEDFLRECRRLGLYETFRPEIEYALLSLIVFQVGAREIMDRDPKSPLLADLSRYVKATLPGAGRNPYLGPKGRMLCRLFQNGCYRTFRLLR